MRYIGNKTRLLDFIRRVLRARGIAPGRAVDPFTGTASVARALKRWGHQVEAADIMEYGYVFARAYVETIAQPHFPGLAPLLDGDSLGAALSYLNELPPDPGFVHDTYSPAGTAGRMYFTAVTAARIDAIRTAIEGWRRSGLIEESAYFVLLAALIEAADRVANTTGVYAAYVKSWQPNASRPMQLRTARLVAGNGCRARRADALEVVRDAAPFDLLYLDPPYNNRQYAGYYHVPELLALGWFDGRPVTRGKTGLIDDRDKRSAWSSTRHCEAAFAELLAAARCRHIVMSYNAEGILPEATIERLLKEYGRRGTYRRYRQRYRRYRSDAEGEHRRYRASVVEEYLYCVDR